MVNQERQLLKDRGTLFLIQSAQRLCKKLQHPSVLFFNKTAANFSAVKEQSLIKFEFCGCRLRSEAGSKLPMRSQSNGRGIQELQDRQNLHKVVLGREFKRKVTGSVCRGRETDPPAFRY